MALPKFSHILLTVSDMDKARAFYGDLLGFDLKEYQGWLFFEMENHASCWLVTHDQTPENDRFSEFRIGLDHLAFSAPSKEFLDELAEKLIAAGVDTQGVEIFHGNWYYVAFRDPDNIQLEYWLDEPINKPEE
ncbi:MAG: VOC family protein [Anaerolineae bacterium]|nr:VOC family protein [Anaerolineae bacterium]